MTMINYIYLIEFGYFTSELFILSMKESGYLDHSSRQVNRTSHSDKA